MTVLVFQYLLNDNGRQRLLRLSDGVFDIGTLGANFIAIPMTVVEVEEEKRHYVLRLVLPGPASSSSRQGRSTTHSRSSVERLNSGSIKIFFSVTDAPTVHCT